MLQAFVNVLKRVRAKAFSQSATKYQYFGITFSCENPPVNSNPSR